jgi:hypothetical protein
MGVAVDPVLALAEPRPTVEPGGEARITVTVRNAGSEVEQYRLEVLGDCARWTDVLPRQVSVLPEEAREETVTVVFRPPPAPAAVAGEIPFGVRCVSLESPDRCAVVEGDLTVGAVVGLRDRLDPVTPRGRWTGRYEAVFDNTGSVPVTLKLSASDAKRMLRFALAPPELTVAPGKTATGYVMVKPRQPTALGAARQHPFTVEYETTGGEVRRGQLAGIFEQRPILSKALVAVAAVLVAAIGAGAFLLLRRDTAPTGPTPIAGPPPPVAMASVSRVTDNSVQLVWQRSPYATGYVVQEVLPDGSVGSSKQIDERDQSALTWTELAPGKHCFRVLAVGTSGRSTPSEPKCVELAAPPPSVAASAPPAGSSAGPEPVRGAYVIYTPPTAIDDRTAQGVAEKLVAKLQALGVPARLVDSRDSKRIADGTGGLWVVLQDGFPTFDAALAECNKRRSVAPDCFAVAP